MAFVHHYERVVLVGQFRNLVHRGYVAVHGEYAVRHDDAETLCLGELELFFKVFHVCVGITITYCFAEPYAVDDGCVVERVGDDGILVREERFEYASVRIEACGVEDGVLRTEILRNGGFELLVDVLRTADEAYGGHAVTACIHLLLGCLHEPRVVGETQVVVGAEVEYLLAAHLDFRPLGRGDYPFFLVEASLPDVCKFFLQKLFHFSVHDIR